MTTEKPEAKIRFKLDERLDGVSMTIREVFGRHVILKRAEDGLFDELSWHPSQRKAEQALIAIITTGKA